MYKENMMVVELLVLFVHVFIEIVKMIVIEIKKRKQVKTTEDEIYYSDRADTFCDEFAR